MAFDFHDIQKSLMEILLIEHEDKVKKDAINSYLKDVYGLARKPAPEFEKGLEWINVTEPLRLNSHLKGKIVLLDFFTYCCINCMHILPDLKALEHRYSVEDGLVVVGVHSPKFANEKETANVAAAVARYHISHAVVSDPMETMWQALNVCCWPTLILLGPRGEPILELMGEGHRELLELFIGEAIRFFADKNELSPHKIDQLCVSKQVAGNAESSLRFPGKVAVCGNLVAIADTGNHRVIVADRSTGQVQHIIGGSEPGSRDGSFSEARFNSCQGLAFRSSNLLYIADTENHTIREADLVSRTVKTVAGKAGEQGVDRVGGAEGPQQAISSPWDVCLVGEGRVLLIAMAGTHQLWALFLEDTVWWKNRSYSLWMCACVAGNGKEENTNNLYPMSASFAQPSGVVTAGQCVFVADSESSTVRRLQLQDGRVQAVVGATLDRKNLFSFGDVDGRGMDAKLQHPLGVAWCERTGTVYVADSYNHKIKCIDPLTNTCTTYTAIDPAFKLNEPGGLCVEGDDLYIADTNNQRILVVDTRNKTTRKFDLKMTSELPKNLPAVVESGIVRVPWKQACLVELRIKIAAPTGSSFPSEKMIRWEMHPPTDGCKLEVVTSKLEGSTAEWQLSIGAVLASPQMILIVCSAPLCSGQTCSAWKGTFKMDITPDDSATNTDSIVCDIKHTIKL
ncbi:hypothetical protein LSTR_LSTR003885 [Laodelphax striatellus]|uniref:Thioredoxin domain-containing protein n=1 Tax=Laodelphax striatellus TaxID=195883 RepID=A0A482XE22_LAOST|nr:hypothetical protein LSTR_LSTR003885 [Laodelphax striatellus]